MYEMEMPVKFFIGNNYALGPGCLKADLRYSMIDR